MQHPFAFEDITDRCYCKFRELIEQRGLFENISHYLIMFSCGKDCSMMLDLCIRYQEETGIRLPYSVFCAPFPKHMYFTAGETPNENYRQIMDYWKKRNVEILTAIPPYDDFEDGDREGCRICKRSRKAVIDQHVNTFPGSTGIMTGFTIYDALSYLNMILLNCNFDLYEP